MNTAINRTQVALLTNKSGGAVAQGDVIIIDSANAAAFTTTTTAAFVDGLVGVVMEPNGIANDAQGMVAFGGYVPKISLSASASLGDVFGTHSVAKQAVRHNPPLVAGDFGIVLGTGTSPAAWLFDMVNQGAAGGTNTGWALLGSTVLGSDGALAFSSIPSTYQALKLRLRLRTDVAATTDQVKLRVGNGSVDTGSNYGYGIGRLGSTNANAQSLSATGIDNIIVPGNNATANVFGEIEITINDYAVTTYWRNMLIFGGHPDTGTYRVNMGAGVWKNAAAAIDCLDVIPGAGTNWKAGSAAWLYGLKTS